MAFMFFTKRKQTCECVLNLVDKIKCWHPAKTYISSSDNPMQASEEESQPDWCSFLSVLSDAFEDTLLAAELERTLGAEIDSLFADIPSKLGPSIKFTDDSSP